MTDNNLLNPRLWQNRFDSIDPLDNRYFDQEIAKYLSEGARIAYQAHMEGVLTQTLADFGICSSDVADEISKAASEVDPMQVAEEEKTTKHDVKALVNVIKGQISDQAKPFVHFGATSYDIVVNASVLQYKATIEELILPRVDQLMNILLDLSKQYADTIQIGRTHGQHAVPITFGFAIAEYVSRLGQSRKNLEKLANELQGKFSGAVGAYNALSVFVDDPIDFEKKLLSKVDLTPAQYSNQIVPPEQTLRVLHELGLISGIMANLSHDMRHLQRTEIAEVREKFEKGQTGSSTMAHKRNPWNFENVISMHKQVMGQLFSAEQNISSEHQRDLTDSASARFYPIIFAAVASMSSRLARVMSKIEVDQHQMQKNLRLSGGAIAAEPLYLLLEKYGHTEAHEAAKRVAHQAIEKNQKMAEVAAADEEISNYWQKFSEEERDLVSNPEKKYSGFARQKALEIHKNWSN